MINQKPKQHQNREPHSLKSTNIRGRIPDSNLGWSAASRRISRSAFAEPACAVPHRGDVSQREVRCWFRAVLGDVSSSLSWCWGGWFWFVLVFCLCWNLLKRDSLGRPRLAIQMRAVYPPPTNALAVVSESPKSPAAGGGHDHPSPAGSSGGRLPSASPFPSLWLGIVPVLTGLRLRSPFGRLQGYSRVGLPGQYLF